MRYVDRSWDFVQVNTKRATHCFHSYPAMMIPQIAEKLLNKYGMNSKRLFDPYCGTGTSLVEANIKGINAIGTDLNPLARLIAKAKTTHLDIQMLNFYLKKINDYICEFRFGIKSNKCSVVLPKFKNIDFWFNQIVQYKLSLIKSFINEISQEDIKRFFLIAFSETVRESSMTKKGEFKLIRIPEEKRREFDPDCFEMMLSKLNRNKQGIIELYNIKINGATSKIQNFNTVNSIPNRSVGHSSIDIVITSPPYGDSKTTVAYGQYSRLSNQWMGIENASRIDQELMGGKINKQHIIINSKTLKKNIEEIESQDKKRANEVLSFFNDYQKSINNVSRKLKKKGYACYVVGNRTVKGIKVQMDEITKDFFEYNNFSHIETIIRNIPNKRMPSKNSPSNIIGKKSPTIKQEYIVVMQKQ